MIKIFRCITGDEIMGEITNISENEEPYRKSMLQIKNPCLLGFLAKEQRLVFLDLLMYSDEKKIELKSQDILFIAEPKPELLDKYKSFWNPPSIIMPEENKIIS